MQLAWLKTKVPYTSINRCSFPIRWAEKLLFLQSNWNLKLDPNLKISKERITSHSAFSLKIQIENLTDVKDLMLLQPLNSPCFYAYFIFTVAFRKHVLKNCISCPPERTSEPSFYFFSLGIAEKRSQESRRIRRNLACRKLDECTSEWIDLQRFNRWKASIVWYF